MAQRLPHKQQPSIVTIECIYEPVFRAHAHQPHAFFGWCLGGTTFDLNLSGQFLRAVRKLRAVGRKNFTDRTEKGLNITRMNLYNLVLRMVDRVILYPIAHVPSYLGIRGTSNFLDVIIFAVGFIFLYKFVQFVRVAMFIAKMDVVRISTYYQFVQKCSRRQ